MGDSKNTIATLSALLEFFDWRWWNLRAENLLTQFFAVGSSSPNVLSPNSHYCALYPRCTFRWCTDASAVSTTRKIMRHSKCSCTSCTPTARCAGTITVSTAWKSLWPRRHTFGAENSRLSTRYAASIIVVAFVVGYVAIFLSSVVDEDDVELLPSLSIWFFSLLPLFLLLYVVEDMTVVVLRFSCFMVLDTMLFIVVVIFIVLVSVDRVGLE